jgi:hypothetical protein
VISGRKQVIKSRKITTMAQAAMAIRIPQTQDIETNVPQQQ